MTWSKLMWLALGAFAIGTEGYVVAGLLPTIAGDLHVSISAAGQLIAAFALAYALGSPVLAVATGRMERKRLLLISLAVFGVLNVVAALVHSYATLLVVRVGMALAAGTFVPAASAYAVAVVPAAHRGRALSVIFAGLTVAMMIGVPIGVVVGAHFGWRSTFIGVAGMAAIAFVGLAATLAPVQSTVAIPLKDRLAVARRPDVFKVLINTLVALTGVYAVFAYLAPLLSQVAHIEGTGLAAVMFVFGSAAAVGNFVGGGIVDRIGPWRVLTLVFAVLSVLFVVLSTVGTFLPPETARWVIVPLLGIWGLVGSSFPSAQQVRMAALAPKLAPLTLALNASAIYLGASCGAFLGGMVLEHRSAAQLGWVGAGCELVALTLLLGAARQKARQPAVAEPDEAMPEPQPATEPM